MKELRKKDNILERFFRFREFSTSWRVECLAGLTTFLAMSYIIFVNAHILELAGMSFDAVFVATCLTTAIGSFLVGALANYPIAVAPGMALNVYFSFVVVQEMGYSWQMALGMTFIAGILFLVLSLTKVLRYLISAIPETLHTGLAAGIGIFIMLIGLKNAGLVDISNHLSFISKNLFSLQTVLFFLGLIILLVLEYFQWMGAIVLSILCVTAASLYFNLTQFHGFFSAPPSLSSTWMALDMNMVRGATENGHAIFSVLSVIFVFFLITVFDATGTFIGFLGTSTNDKMPKALLADSVATVAGSLLGTSSTSPFIESAAGIRAGGRTGVTSIVTAILFLMALFISPLAATIPSFATAPALLYVGFLMASHLRKVEYRRFSEAVPALLTALIIPLQFSIADGIAIGVFSYCAIKLFSGKRKEINQGLGFLLLLFVIFCMVQWWII